MKKIVILIPTYNERDLIIDLLNEILVIKKKNIKIDVFVIDDNSPDGTGEIVESHFKETKRVTLIRREQKAGIAKAYISGFKTVLQTKEYHYIIQMDADFSHRPLDLSAIIDALLTARHDLVIGSRYVQGVSVVKWPIKRILLSYFAGVYVRLFTGLNIQDPTGGFNGYSSKIFEKLDIEKIAAEGYIFQVEMKYNVIKMGFSALEIPIIFEDRRAGTSKLSGNIIVEALLKVLFLRFKKLSWKK